MKALAFALFLVTLSANANDEDDASDLRFTERSMCVVEKSVVLEADLAVRSYESEVMGYSRVRTCDIPLNFRRSAVLLDTFGPAKDGVSLRLDRQFEFLELTAELGRAAEFSMGSPCQGQSVTFSRESPVAEADTLWSDVDAIPAELVIKEAFDYQQLLEGAKNAEAGHWSLSHEFIEELISPDGGLGLEPLGFTGSDFSIWSWEDGEPHAYSSSSACLPALGLAVTQPQVKSGEGFCRYLGLVEKEGQQLHRLALEFDVELADNCLDVAAYMRNLPWGQGFSISDDFKFVMDVHTATHIVMKGEALWSATENYLQSIDLKGELTAEIALTDGFEDQAISRDTLRISGPMELHVRFEW